MNRLSLLLLILLTCLSLFLVDAQQQARTKFVALERAEAEQRRLAIEWATLQYEQSMLAKSARINELARGNLRMVLPSPTETVYLPAPVEISNEGLQ